jgi:two-component system alkaline phosphatase synthesis response regulator PhoP
MSTPTERPLVLVIEAGGGGDDAHYASAIISQESFQILTTHSVERGIELAEMHQPKAIILDLNEDALDGYGALKLLRETSSTCLIPVIVLVAKNDHESCIKALDLGADDYISRPLKSRELTLRLKTSLSGPRRWRMNSAFLSAGDLEVDPIAFTVSIKGRRVDLALMEFKMLCLLMSRPGEVISRGELLKAVWGADADVDIRSVDTYVYRVRTRLGDCGAMLQTARGQGYLFQKPHHP